MFPRFTRLIRGLGGAASILFRGQVRTGWEALADELQIAALSWRYGVPGARSPRTTDLVLSDERLPSDHVHLSIAPGGVLLGPLPTERNAFHSRFRRYRIFVTLACDRVPPPNEVREFVLSLGDGHYEEKIANRTTLVFNRRRGSPAGIVLIPNVDFARTYGHAHRRRKIDRALRPWAERIPKAVWRGSSTGVDHGGGNPRLQLCRAGLTLQEIADFRIGRLLQTEAHSPAAVAVAEGLVGNFLPPEEQTNYRWLVSIDGNAGEWEGMFWKLYSGSPVLMVASQWEQWYTSLLKPWEHFIPVAADLSDLEERLHWCRAHDEESRQIGERARSLLRTEVTFERALDYLAAALSQVPPAS